MLPRVLYPVYDNYNYTKLFISYNMHVAANQTWKSIFPLTLIRQYLRVDGTHDDDIINIVLQSAEMYCEKMVNIVISRKDLNVSISNFYGLDFDIRYKPIVSVQNVMIDDKSISSADYRLVDGHIIFTQSKSGKLTFTMTSGYQSIQDVPKDIQHCILMHTAYLYECRSDLADQAPKAVTELYRSIKNIKF